MNWLYDGSSIHYITEMSEKLLYMTSLSTLEGEYLCWQVMKIKKRNLLAHEPFDRMPKEEDYFGETGKEGISTTHFYRTWYAVNQAVYLWR